MPVGAVIGRERQRDGQGMAWDARQMKVVTSALLKNAIPAVALAAAGIVLWRWNPRLSSVVLLVGSFLLFLKTYRKPWRLRWFTCLLPAVAALGGYLIQVFWFDVHKPLGPMGLGVIAGAVVGYLRGRGHRLEVKDGAIWAHRTVVVLVLWLATYLLTQSSALFGRTELVEWGLTGGAFTTTIVVVFSIVLFTRYRAKTDALPDPGRTSAQAVAAGVTGLVVGCALVVGVAVPALGVDPAQVTLDGDWELDRREHDACVVSVPPVLSGTIHIEADFETGTVTGRFDGSGAGSYTLPAECDTADPSDYDRTHLETWTADLPVIRGTFSGPLDPATGAFEVGAIVYVEGGGERAAPGSQYMCNTDYMTDTCVFGEFVQDQQAMVSGTIHPTDPSIGGIDWYTVFCAKVSPTETQWGDHCPRLGAWVAGATSVVWQENAAPEVGGISAVPDEPTSDDTVVLTVDATDADGDELTYTWSIDGERQSVSGPSVSWPKPTAGDHTITVVVSDGADTAEAFLDVRVYEGSAAADLDDDGVPDDEDLCPEEWGLGDDGCPPFSATIGCVPVRPMPETAVTCAVQTSGRHVGESLIYDWYLDGGSVLSGSASTWTWGESTGGGHEVLVDVRGEGRSATATLALEVAGGMVDEETAGFSIGSLGCNSGISSDEVLGCSASIARTRSDVGGLSATWSLNGQAVSADMVQGSATGWSVDRPPPGDHTVEVVVVDPNTGYGQAASTAVSVRSGARELEQAAAAAAALTGFALLLAGAGINTYSSAASAFTSMSTDQVEDSIRQAAAASTELIDPRDGQVLQTDGDRVYWDDDAGWIDRTTATLWIAQIATQHLQQGQDSEATWAQIQEDRDRYYTQRDWQLSQSGYQWDPNQQAYVHPMWVERPPPVPTIAQVHVLQDFIDDNAHLLTDKMQESVAHHLASMDWSAVGGEGDRLNFADINSTDRGREQFQTLAQLADAVDNSVTGQRWSQQAAQQLSNIDRAETNAVVWSVGTGIVRFGLSRLDPTQGFLVGSLFGAMSGYMATPEGGDTIYNTSKYALIGGICTYVDVRASNLAPANFLWNTTTGAMIGGAEQALYGGTLEDIGRGALFGGAANGIFSTLQRPGVRAWMGDPGATRIPGPSGLDDGGSIRPAVAADDGLPIRPVPIEPDAGGPMRPVDDGTTGPRPVPDGDADAAPSRTPAEDPYADLPPIEETFPTRGPLPDSAFADAPQRPGAVVTDNTASAWNARDQALGIQREHHLPMGIDQAPEFVTSRNLSWLNQVDGDIRRVWQEAGGGREPGSWNKFVNGIEQRIQAGEMDAGQVDGWFRMYGESVGAAQPSGFIKGIPAPTEMNADLVPGYISRTVASDNPADQLALFQDGGRRNLGLWEEMGVITPEQAAVLNGRGSTAVDDAMIRTAPETIRRFEADTGVGVERVHVADSGSSAGSGARSIAGTDNDRTLVPTFTEPDVLGLARDRYPNLPPEQAIARTHQELTQQYTQHTADTAGDYLRGAYGVESADLGFGVYGGINAPRPGGPTDLYGGGTVRVRTSVQGQGTVIEPDGSFHRTSGDAVVDAEHLQRSRYGWSDEPMSPTGDIRRMTPADYQATLREQAHTAARIDPLDTTQPQLADATKAVQRAAETGKRMGVETIDPKFVRVAEQLRLRPQEAPQILADAGMTRRTFLERARASVLQQVDALSP